MKAIIWTAAAATVAGFVGTASAADYTPYVPPAAPFFAAPAYDWNGFYLGAHLGGAWQQLGSATADPSTGVAGMPVGSESSFMGGGQLGVNFALWPNWLFGMEADISGAFLHGNGVATDATGTIQVQYDSKTDMFGTVRGRAGYMWNNFLFYGTGGFAWADGILTRTQLAGMTGGATPGVVDHASGNSDGWVAGAGLEWAFAPKWTARFEYLHLDVGSHPYMLPSAGFTRNVGSTIDVVRVGLNYRFNLLSLGP